MKKVLEKTLENGGKHTSWASVREKLSTHQVATVVLEGVGGERIQVRKAVNPGDEQTELYSLLGVRKKIRLRGGREKKGKSD